MIVRMIRVTYFNPLVRNDKLINIIKLNILCKHYLELFISNWQCFGFTQAYTCMIIKSKLNSYDK